MQNWCVMFYNGEHRCVMNYISTLILEKRDREISDINVSQFFNYSNIIIDLQHGHLINISDVKIDKESRKSIKINWTFFRLLPNLLQKIKEKTNKEREK
jgi:hypothetical protein